MSIESKIFKRRVIDFDSLEKFGFIKENNVYKYSKVFMDTFRADITIDNKNNVTGKVYDTNLDEEYFNFRIEKQTGEFVSKVREEYKNMLKTIAYNCSKKLYFITEQANRITNKIRVLYNDEPVFAWDKYPGYGIFKNTNNDKWYGLIMNIDKNKLDKKDSLEVEIINVKLDSLKIPTLLQKEGIYPAYHMNKNNWVSIILDDTLSDEEIIDYIKISHSFTEIPSEWIIPANPKYYDVINCFNDTDIITWKQSNDIKVGDIIYLYVASPISAILYKCEAVDVGIDYQYVDKNLSIKKAMKIKLLKRYKEDEYTFDKLNEYGIKAIRGPRSIPKDLSNALNKGEYYDNNL